MGMGMGMGMGIGMGMGMGIGMGMGMGMVPHDGAEENSKAVSTEAGGSGWGRKRGERGEKESKDERNSQILVSMH